MQTRAFPTTAFPTTLTDSAVDLAALPAAHFIAVYHCAHHLLSTLPTETACEGLP